MKRLYSEQLTRMAGEARFPREIAKAPTIKYRQSLLLVSAIALAFVYLDIQPSSIEFLSLQLGDVDAHRGFVVLLVVQFYFLFAFHLHAARDFVAWRNEVLRQVAFTGVVADDVEAEVIGNQGDWKKEHWIVKSTRVGLHFLFDAFEFSLPALLGYSAFFVVLLARVI